MSVYSYVDPREHQAIRAHEGDEVWVILNHVRAEKREEFEHFLHDILMPAADHVQPEVYNKTRVLHPNSENEDGTYTYIFLMDPVVPGGLYSISSILYKFYQPELADNYMKIWHDALASPQIEYDLKQSAW